MKTATEWAYEIDDYVEACMNEDTEYKGIGAFSPYPLEDFVEAIRQEQREACAEVFINTVNSNCLDEYVKWHDMVKQAILNAGKED